LITDNYFEQTLNRTRLYVKFALMIRHQLDHVIGVMTRFLKKVCYLIEVYYEEQESEILLDPQFVEWVLRLEKFWL